MSYAIELENLRKEFDGNVAVRGLSLQVEQGEVFGFLGPNGAGKTTSIKMMLGLVAPTSGGGQLLSSPLGTRATRAQIGFLPEHFRFHDWLTAAEFLTLHSELYGLSAARRKARIADLLELVGLTPHAAKRLGAFSKGMLQRIGLAQALLNEPRLVFLDEPTSGLDPVGRRLVRDIIRELKQRGTTIFLNSHLLSEIEITCDRVAFIKHGQVLRTGSLRDLATGATRLVIRATGLSAQGLAGLSQWGRDVRADGEHISMILHDDSDTPGITRHLLARGAQVYALTPQQRSLEDLFIEIVGTDGGL